MQPISAEVVEQTWQRVAALTRREGERLAQKFVAEQPAVTAYLLAVDRDLFSDEERELLFYLGTVVWQIMAQGAAPLPRVTEQALEQAEDVNLAMLKSQQEASDENMRAAMAQLLQEYAQPEVFRYVVEALMESAREEDVPQDNLGVMMVDLKTVIDCLNEAK
ncbi:MAG: hypothetical protein AB1817_02220 [Chloroflexota bacterium]